MSRSGMFVGTGRLFTTVAVVTLSLLAASSPSQAQAINDGIVLDDEPVTWPSFSEVLNQQSQEQRRPPLEPPFVWTANGEIRTTATVQAPLPPAVATGVFMLGANWIATRLWKKRKI